MARAVIITSTIPITFGSHAPRAMLWWKSRKGAESALVAASEQTSSEIYVYPKLGQSEEQRDRDRYQCYLWAAQESGFDPASTDQDSDKAGDYRRAISACLEGRGYTVK